MDLALALVEDDHGSALALRVARQLVLFTQRSGGQSQFSAQLAVRRADREPLREVLAHIAEHLDGDLSVPDPRPPGDDEPADVRPHLPGRGGATTPAAFVRASRVEAARRLLEGSDAGLADVARQCGFGTVETMHRAFRRTVHTTPGAYRRHFSPPSELSA